MKSRTTPIARLLALATLTLSGCGVSELYVGFLQVDGGASSTTTSGTGGTGGASLCTPGTTQPCYSGPIGTEGQGICKAGTQTCAADGASWGACIGEVLPQMENCATPEDENCDGLAPPCKGALRWAKGFGGTGIHNGFSVATDSAGDVLVAGAFTGSVDFGGGPLLSAGGQDIFVVKLDVAGNHVWSVRFGGVGDDVAEAIAVDADGNSVLTGYFTSTVDFGGGALQSAGNGDIFLAKLDASGVHVWSKRFGDAADQHARSVAIDGAGNIAVTGSFAGVVDFGGGPLSSAGGQEVFAAKVDAGGAHLWSRRFGSGTGRGVACDVNGNTLITGPFLGTLDFGGTSLVSAGGQDVFVAKLDANGAHSWSKGFGDASEQASNALAVDGAGSVLVTGSFSGSMDFGGGQLQSEGMDVFIAKLDGAGQHVWSKRFGDPNQQVAQGLAVDAAMNVILTGYFSGTVDFGGGPELSAGNGDVFLAKLDANGEHLWSKRFGDASGQAGKSVATDGSGNVVVTGQFSGSIDFGGGVLTSAGTSDVFVAAFSP